MAEEKKKAKEEEKLVSANGGEINILAFDLPQAFFEKIFPKKVELINAKFGSIQKSISKTGFFKKLFSKNTLNVNWVGYRYPDLKDNNYKEILLDMYNTVVNNVAKKYIIIKFGKSYINEFAQVINKIKADKPLILFNLQKGDEVNENSFKKFNQPQFVCYHIHEDDPKDPDKNYNYIISYLWEKDCYYNELGNLSCQYSPANLLYEKPKGFIFFNILLTGESRAGKSSLINRMFNKAITFESSKVVSTTLEITHYQLYPQESHSDENKKLNFEDYGGINILDTPGLVESKNLNSVKKVKKELDKLLDDIHIIFFFLRKQSNLDNSIDLLKYIKSKNDERIKKKLNKIPIIFIRNGDDLTNEKNGAAFFQHLKNALKNNGVLDLYDGTINQTKKEINNADDLFGDDDTNSNNFSEFVDGNIIQIYLPKGQNMGKIFSTTNYYFLNNNKPIFNKELDTEFEKMKTKAKRLIDLFIKKQLQKQALSKEENEDYKKIYNECNNFVTTIKKDCNLLYNFELLNAKSIDKYKDLSSLGETFLNLGTILCGSTFGISTLISFPAYFLCLYFAKKNLIGNIASKYGFNNKDIIFYGLQEYVYGNDDGKDFDEKAEKQIKNLFLNILYFIGPIQCLIKARESLLEIYESFESLSNRNENDWNAFKIQKI